MPTDAPLVLQLSAELPEAHLDRLARDLLRDLSRAGLESHATVRPPAQGERGLLADITKLVVDRVIGGAAGAVLECLKAYFIREPRLKIVIRRPDGSELTLEARNLDGAEVLELLRAAERRP